MVGVHDPSSQYHRQRMESGMWGLLEHTATFSSCATCSGAGGRRGGTPRVEALLWVEGAVQSALEAAKHHKGILLGARSAEQVGCLHTNGVVACFRSLDQNLGWG